MGKVRELVDKWAVTFAARLNVHDMYNDARDAEREDAAAHAAELEAKDRRIAELEANAVEEDRAFMADIALREKRIAELEAELAKRELPPLPESVRRVVDEMREQLRCAVVNISAYRARELITWVDTHYPQPAPQWELDAQYIESVVRKFECNAPERLSEIAARIREAHRDSK